MNNDNFDMEMHRLNYLEQQNQAYHDMRQSEAERKERIQKRIDEGDFIGAEIECWSD